ncbi:MAG: hypothetical protein DRR04_13320, partial [Gammaproteobacteria bacterium]
TIGRAVWGSTSRNSPNPSQAASAGDTVIVRAGVYSTSQGTGERYDPIYNPVNDGTANNEIVIIADGRVTLESDTSGRGEPVIGTYGRNYITWDGFFIDESNVHTKADTGPVVIWQSNHVTVQNITVRGKTVNWGDNHNAIRIEYSSNSVVRNNRLHRNRGGANNYNGSAIMLYDSDNILIEHNEIYDAQGGIFVKGAYGGTANHHITIRYNLLYDLNVGITHGIVNDAGRQFGAHTYQNIIRDTDFGIVFIGYNGSSPANIDVVNNTLHNTQFGFFLKPSTSGYRDITFYNNIISGASVSIQGEDITDVSNTDFSHNIYYSSGTLARISYTNYNLNGWNSQFNQDTVGTVTTDPMFVSPSNSNFQLRAGSPANASGIDILNIRGNGSNAPVNLGAFVTGNEVIGITSERAARSIQATTPEPPVLQ